MGWLGAAWLAAKAFFAGLNLARKAKAAGEVDRGELEVRTSRENTAAIERELEP